jgi:hypothetical protein
MKYKNVPKILAEEAWRMITDKCKEKMISLKNVYIESLTKDIAYYINQISSQNAIDFAEWCDDNYFRMGNTSIWSDSTDWEDNMKFTTKELYEVYKIQCRNF